MRIVATGDLAGPVDLDGVDLCDPETFRSGNPHAAWQTLRAQAPVWWHDRGAQTGFWCVTGYSDCERVIKDHRTFSSESGTVLASVGVGDPAGGRTLSLMDPPAHTEIRTVAMRSFSHSALRERGAQITYQVEKLVERFLAGENDVAKLMRRLPMAISGELMGIPEEHWDPIAFWTTAGLCPEDPEFAVGASPAATVRRAHHELFERFSELIALRRRLPGDDLISALIGLRPAGRPMEDHEVLLNCYSFMAGANSTTPHVAAHLILALAEQPQWWQRLRTDPGMIPAVMEEGIRWTSTPHHMVRRVTCDTELGGVALAQGDWVAAWVASANRDETVFDKPYEFNPARNPNPHIGFGIGPHYCIGAALSRLALSRLLQELVERVEHLEPAGPVTHLYSNWINGIVSLPVLAKPRRAVCA